MDSIRFHLLPTRNGGAAENMATDFCSCNVTPEPNAVRFRHYGWHRPAFTFGYSQKIKFIREQLPPVNRLIFVGVQPAAAWWTTARIGLSP